MKRLICVFLFLSLCFPVSFAGAAPIQIPARTRLTPVTLPEIEGVTIFSISPDGSAYLAYEEDFSGFGLIRDGVYTPFTRNEARGVKDEYGWLDQWEHFQWLDFADDPIWSPDGRWLILTCLYSYETMRQSHYPVLIDTLFCEYFLLMNSPLNQAALEGYKCYTDFAVFSSDSSCLYLSMRNTETMQDSERISSFSLYCYQIPLNRMTKLDYSWSKEALAPFEITTNRRTKAEIYSPLDLQDVYLSGPAVMLPDGSILSRLNTDISLLQGTLARIDLSGNSWPDDQAAVCAPVQLYDLFAKNTYALNDPNLRFFVSDESIVISCKIDGRSIFIRKTPEHNDTLYFALSFNNDDPANNESILQILQADTQKALLDQVQKEKKLSYHQSAVAFSPDGRALLCVTQDKNIVTVPFLILLDTMDCIPLTYPKEYSAGASYYTYGTHCLWCTNGTIFISSFGSGGRLTYAFRLE